MQINVPVQHKRSNVPGHQPTPADLLPGQLAINFYDRTLFTKDETNNVIVLGTVSGQLAQLAYTGNWADVVDKPDIPLPYILPIASPSTLGGVMPKLGLKVESDGSLSALVQSVRGEHGTVKTGEVVLTRLDLGLDILDSNDRIKPVYLPDYIVGGMSYQTTWNADTNTPTIPPADSTNLGWLYVVGTPGNTMIDGEDEWNQGDWIISNGTAWERVPMVSGTVLSINGETGVVTLTADNLPGLSQVGKTNKYEDLSNIPSTFPPETHQHQPEDIIGLAEVAVSGSYTDLVDLPDPTITEISMSGEGNPNMIRPINYIASSKYFFPSNFTGSVAAFSLSSGTEGRVRIMKSTDLGGTYEHIGTILLKVGNQPIFSSVTTGLTHININDMIRYEWETGNIAMISITLRATREA